MSSSPLGSALPRHRTRSAQSRLSDAATRGFTLVEMLVTLTVGAVLLAVAAPNLSLFVQNNQLSGESSEFMSALMLARSEAVKRGVPVYVTSATGTSDFSAGYTVWVDYDGNGVLSAGDDSLRMVGSLANQNRLVSTDGLVSVQFKPNGRPSIATAATISFCLSDVRGPAASHLFQLNGLGRPSLAVAACG